MARAGVGWRISFRVRIRCIEGTTKGVQVTTELPASEDMPFLLFDEAFVVDAGSNVRLSGEFSSHTNGST